MNLHRILSCTDAEGPGKRFVIWTQGCKRHCPGCFSIQTWSFEDHIRMDPDELIEQIKLSVFLNNIEGITILGGEPIEQADQLSILLSKMPKNLSVLLFSGYTMQELKDMNNLSVDKVLEYTDVLVDGPYIQEKSQNILPMIGSSNQGFHFLTDRYSIKDFAPDKLQIHIKKNGGVELNGMGQNENLRRILYEVKKYE